MRLLFWLPSEEVHIGVELSFCRMEDGRILAVFSGMVTVGNLGIENYPFVECTVRYMGRYLVFYLVSYSSISKP